MPDPNGQHQLGPGTTAALQKYGQSVAQNLAVARRRERGTIEAVTRLDNQRVVSAQVRIGSQTYEVPWNGAGARVGDVVEVSRAVGTASSPDYTFERFVDSLVAYVYADDDATIPAPTWTGLVLTATMLINAAQQGAQVTLYIKETAEAYGPAATEVRWRRSGVGASWRSMAVPNVGAVDAVLALVLPELLEPEVSYDFQTRTRTISGSVSPYGTTLTQTILPGFTSPTQPAPFTLVPPGPPAIPYLDTSSNLELVIHYPPPSQPTTFDYWQTELAGAAGGPTSVTLKHYGSSGTYKVTSPTTFYLRYREVSKYTSGGAAVVSPWMPGSGYSGPLVLSVAPERDVTPPNPPTDLAITRNAYVVESGMSQQQVRFQWNGEGGSPSTYVYTADFDRFDLIIEGITQPANTVVIPTGRAAIYTAYNAMTPGHQFRMRVRAVDKIGNTTNDSIGPVFTAPTPISPTGTTVVTILAMGYNAVALRIAYTPATALEVAPAGFLLYSTSATHAMTPVLHGFVPATPTGPVGEVGAFHVINPVTTDPPPVPPHPPGTTLVGQTWAFYANPQSPTGQPGANSLNAVGAFTAVDGANLIVNSVHGNKITAATITADKLAAAVILVAQYIRLGAGATFRTNADEVIVDQTGIDVTGENFDVWAGPTPKTNWRGSLRGSTASGAPGAGNPATGLTLRLYEGYLQAQSATTSDAGWTIDPSGTKLYVSNWPATNGYERYYASNGIFLASGARTGAHVPIAPAVYAFGAMAANTSYAFAASLFAGVPADCTAWVVRGFINAAAGTRFYVHANTAAWGIESGGSIVVPAGAGSIDWGPWVIPCKAGDTGFFIRATAAATGGTMWVTGFFK